MPYITPADLESFGVEATPRVDAMIADAEAMAVQAAPCLADPDVVLSEAQRAAVRAVLRRAILRWNDAGNAGQRTQVSQSVGPWSQGQTTEVSGSKGLFWPSEIKDFQAVCAAVTTDTKRRAHGVDQIGPGAATDGHTPWCSITWGDWCSCGAYLTRGEFPLYEESPRVV